MIRYEVTPQLAGTIKTLRQNRNITAKFIADSIGKSQSYISRLEKGGIKTITDEELKLIFRLLFPEQKEIPNEDILELVLKTGESKYLESQNNFDDEVWFYNFDTVERWIPIPPEIIDDIIARMNGISLSIVDLVNRINSNEDIREEKIVDPALMDGYWHNIAKPNEKPLLVIFMKIEETTVQKILAKDQRSANYVTILALVYYLIKFEKELSTVKDESAWKAAIDYLNQHKFYSISEKSKLLKNIEDESQYETLLTTFEKDNRQYIEHILEIFRSMSTYDLESVNKNLSAFSKNLDWDCGFMMNVISIPFSDFSNMSFTLKKQLLNEIKEITAKYSLIPKDQNRIEQYD